MQIESKDIRIRDFGMNYGVPYLHVCLSEGVGQATDVMKDIVTSANPSLVFLECEPIKGLGVVVSGLRQIGFTVETQFTPKERTYAWLNKVEYPIVRWKPNLAFNFYSITTSKGVIVFKVATQEQWEEVERIFVDLRLVPTTKWLVVLDEFRDQAIALAREYSRTRISIVN